MNKLKLLQFAIWLFGLFSIFIVPISIFAQDSPAGAAEELEDETAYNLNYRQARLYFSERDYTRAEEYFLKVITNDPEHGNSHFYLAYIYEKRGNKSVANDYYCQAVDLTIDDELKEKSFWKIVLYYRHREEWENLQTYAEKFLQFRQFKKVEELLEEARQNASPLLREAQSYYSAGKASMLAKNYEDAATQFNQALYYMPEHQPLRWELARAYMHLKNFAAAHIQLQYLMQVGSNWAYFYRAGLCSYFLREYQRAQMEFNQALQVNTKPGAAFNYSINFQLGRLQLSMGYFSEARNYLKEALKARSTGDLLGHLALTEFALQNFSQARKYREDAIKLEKEQPEAIMARSLEKLRSKEGEAAVVILKKFLSGSASRSGGVELNYAALYLVARELALQKNWSLSSIYFEQVYENELEGRLITGLVLASNPRIDIKRDYNFYYGQALLFTNQPEVALNKLKYIQGTPEGSYLIARAHAALQSVSLARYYLKEATNLNPALWKNAAQDPVFRELSLNDNDFAQFIKYRGEPPPPPVVQPQAPTTDHSQPPIQSYSGSARPQ